jgi:hypothetical protein
MNTAVFEQFLIQATGLPRKQVIKLYNAGYPWPLWTAHDVRRAGILAQAKGLLFPDALNEAEAMGEAKDEAFFATLEAADRANGVTLTKRMQAMLSLPWFKDTHVHIEKVAAHTTAAPRTVYLLCMAIQRFAILHPGFELIGTFPHRRRFLC